MNHVSFRRFAALVAIIVSASLATAPAQADGKRKRSGTNTFISTLQKNASAITDVPGHEISQQIALQRTTKLSDPALLDMQITDFGQVDEVAGTGTHRGYSMAVLKDGSSSPTRYEGTHKKTVKADGSWDSVFEGKYWLLPGTGKMKNVKGEGTYKCKYTADGSACDWEEESEY